jgi:hypothetical protein
VLALDVTCVRECRYDLIWYYALLLVVVAFAAGFNMYPVMNATLRACDVVLCGRLTGRACSVDPAIHHVRTESDRAGCVPLQHHSTTVWYVLCARTRSLACDAGMQLVPMFSFVRGLIVFSRHLTLPAVYDEESTNSAYECTR